MTKTQMTAVNQLQRALNACANAGLSGGVFDGTFCIWPLEQTREIHAGAKGDFFVNVETHGCMLHVSMQLDGGAGI
jgi:hypothetical protein